METNQLKVRVQELEAELAALRTTKDNEVQWLQHAVSAGQTALLEESKDAEVTAKLERHRALDALRQEHEHILERQLVAEEKHRTEQWISNIKKGFQVEQRSLLEQIT